MNPFLVGLVVGAVLVGVPAYIRIRGLQAVCGELALQVQDQSEISAILRSDLMRAKDPTPSA